MSTTLAGRVQYLRKVALAPILYRKPMHQLRPERLYLWTQTLADLRQDVPGDVVEVGCASGGTAAHAARLLAGLGSSREYWAYDTFDGFVPAQFDHDAQRGTDPAARTGFSASSPKLVRRIVNQLGAPQVRLVQADVCVMPEGQFPTTVAAALVDVDLYQPVLASLRKLWPRIAERGVVLVDDCDERTSFRARQAYEEFCSEIGRMPSFIHGMGWLVR